MDTQGSGPTQSIEVKDVNGKFKTLEELEHEHVEQVYRYYFGNITRTHKALGIGRTTLYRKLKSYGLK